MSSIFALLRMVPFVCDILNQNNIYGTICKIHFMRRNFHGDIECFGNCIYSSGNDYSN